MNPIYPSTRLNNYHNFATFVSLVFHVFPDTVSFLFYTIQYSTLIYI